MRPVVKHLSVVANNPWFMVIAGLCSVVGFVAYLYEKIDPQFGSLAKVGAVVAFLPMLFGYFYSIRVRSENIALRSMARLFYEINEIYKSKLQESFFGSSPLTNPGDLIATEKLVLRSVCHRIENIFSSAIDRQCMVTVKLVLEKDEKIFAQTYVRSQELCPRDNPERTLFEVKTGQNRAFDAALMPRADGRPAHFFSADLSKLTHSDSDYSNERQHYISYYKSVLVVPIQGERSAGGAKPTEPDLLGYLCVDTLSTHRLNDRYHLYMLAALSHQMYNFMSLMRGRYTVLVG